MSKETLPGQRISADFQALAEGRSQPTIATKFVLLFLPPHLAALWPGAFFNLHGLLKSPGSQIFFPGASRVGFTLNPLLLEGSPTPSTPQVPPVTSSLA